MTRRHFFFGSLALAAGCSRRTQDLRLRHHVSVMRAGSYSVDLEAGIRQILIEHNVPIRGKRVVLKPNLVEFKPGAPINTNPVFVAAAASAFEALGAASVQIAEGPGHRRTTLDMAEAAGYFESVSK